NKGADEQWADLELIFNHLDAPRKGKISLRTIRNALSMVKLSEDPARHAHLSESIVSCFGASGGTVDFPQFAEVMGCRDRGRNFQTLQDELTSEGLAAAKAHFANIFRREVVVRGLLDNGRSDGLMCSVYQQMLFKTEGAAALSNGRMQELRLSEEAFKRRRAREVEIKRATQAKQKLLESRAVSGTTRRCPPQVPSPPNLTLAPVSGDMLKADGMATTCSKMRTTPHHSKVEKLEWQPKAMEAAVRRRFGGKTGLAKQNAIERSSAEIGILLRKEAIREASALLRVDNVYRHPTPPAPSTRSPVTRTTQQAFRERTWWLGSRVVGESSSNAATAMDDCSRTKAMASVVSGGFVHFPPPSVRRLRRRCRRRPSRATAGLGLRGGHGRPSPCARNAVGPDDPETIAHGAFGVTSRRKDAIHKRTPLCGRSAVARLPSWASCDNSACDPWTALPPQLQRRGSPSSANASLDEGGPTAQKACREVGATSTTGATGSASLLLAGQAGPAPAAKQLEARRDWDTSSLTTIAATVPNVLTHDPYAPLLHAVTGQGQGQGPASSNISSTSSLASARATIHLNGGGDAVSFGDVVIVGARAPEKGNELPWRPPSPHRPENSDGKSTVGACRRPAGGGHAPGEGRGRRGAVATAAKNYPPSTPWRAPRVARCMRRPEPGGR
ncbi:unnamed protein product, partial [Hapterophycus canaliculatus]